MTGAARFLLRRLLFAAFLVVGVSAVVFFLVNAIGNPIDVLIEFPAGQSLYSPETLGIIGDVHALVEKQAGLGNVWSIETLRR